MQKGIVVRLYPNNEQKELFKTRYLDWIENNAFAKKIRGNKTTRF